MEKAPEEVGGDTTLPKTKDEGKVANPGRRRALEKLFGLTLIAAPFTHSAKEFVEETVFSGSTEKELHSYLKKLNDEYGVEIDFSAEPGTEAEVSAQELSLAEKKDLTKNIYLALRLYPREYVEKSGLKKIRGVKWMDIAGLKWFQELLGGSGGYVDTRKEGVLHLNKESTAFGIPGMLGWTSDDRVRYATHHELFHVADLHLLETGSLDRWSEEGEKLGVARPDPEHPSLVRKSGYAAPNGSLAPEEDRAEIAAMLFTKYSRLQHLARKEPALGDKTAKIKRELYERSGGLIDGAYWDLLERGDTAAIQEYFTVKRRLRSAA